jgi:hypothetical protein
VGRWAWRRGQDKQIELLDKRGVQKWAERDVRPSGRLIVSLSLLFGLDRSIIKQRKPSNQACSASVWTHVSPVRPSQTPKWRVDPACFRVQNKLVGTHGVWTICLLCPTNSHGLLQTPLDAREQDLAGGWLFVIVRYFLKRLWTNTGLVSPSKFYALLHRMFEYIYMKY